MKTEQRKVKNTFKSKSGMLEKDCKNISEAFKAMILETEKMKNLLLEVETKSTRVFGNELKKVESAEKGLSCKMPDVIPAIETNKLEDNILSEDDEPETKPENDVPVEKVEVKNQESSDEYFIPKKDNVPDIFKSGEEITLETIKKVGYRKMSVDGELEVTKMERECCKYKRKVRKKRRSSVPVTFKFCSQNFKNFAELRTINDSTDSEGEQLENARLGTVKKTKNSEDVEKVLRSQLEKSTLDPLLESLDLGKTEVGFQHGVGRSTSNSLDVILSQMRSASDKRRQLEKEHSGTVALLREKQTEMERRAISGTSSSYPTRAKDMETIESLQSKIRELGKKLELQNVLHEELLLEMAAIKRSSGRQVSASTGTLPISFTDEYGTAARESILRSGRSASHQEVQTSPVGHIELLLSDRTYLGHSAFSSGRQPSVPAGRVPGMTSTSSYADLPRATSESVTFVGYKPNPDLPEGTACVHIHEPTSRIPQSDINATQTSDQYVLAQKRRLENLCVDPKCPFTIYRHPATKLSQELDKIVAKIHQDNKTLEELNNSRLPTSFASVSAQNIAKVNEPAVAITTNTFSNIGMPPLQTSIIQQPMPIVTTTVSSSLAAYPPLSSAYSLLDRRSLLPPHISQIGTIPTSQQLYSIPSSYQFGIPSQMPTGLNTHLDVETAYNAIMSGSNTLRNDNITTTVPYSSAMTRDTVSRSVDSDLDRIHDMVEIPGKGLCHIYIAKYSYDPFSHSTGCCPEAELAVNAGDYLLVWANSEDENYVDAELMDGRRGLVPVTYIQKLSGEELMDFSQRVLTNMKEADDSVSTAVPQDIEGSCRTKFGQNTAVSRYEYGRRYGGEYGLCDITEEEEEEDTGENVPAPKQLTLERQLNKSIVIRWNPPENIAAHSIDSYHVYVDKMLKATVKATERTKALLEGVDSTKPHRISVRSVTHNRRTSRDAACTMLIGKDVPAYPTNVRAVNVTATSAVISWLPSNSNFQHTVCVNNVEVRTVRPGVYRHTITGLVPNTLYRVTVRAKNIRSQHYDEKLAMSDKYSTHIDFHTLPKGLPDPPTEIQVEPGPQDGTLLVTWVPVSTANANGALITGYAVYADGKKVTEIDSPTGDHALIDINKIMSLNPKHVTVRTKSKENYSADSPPIPIAMSRNRHQHSAKTRSSPRSAHQSSRHQSRNAYGQIIIEPDENLSDKEIYPGQDNSVPLIEITKDPNVDSMYSEEDIIDRRTGRGFSQQQMGKMHGPPRSHAERGRPPMPQMNQPERMHRVNYDAIQDERGDYGNERRMDQHHSPYGTSRRVLPTGDIPHSTYGHEPSSSHRNYSRSQSPDKNGRWCVALFDYDPMSMSPNPNASVEEIPFKRGDRIKIYGEKDADGFYWGECRGRRGFVPHNMITDASNADALDDMKKRNRINIVPEGPPKQMVAMYDYDPKQASPNTDADIEISFNRGQVVTVYGEPDEDGFYIGEVDGIRGLVPSNYLEEVSEFEHLPYGKSTSRTGRVSSSQYDRGHGPGVRGPPPPPRDGMAPLDSRDRRKGSNEPETISGDRKTSNW